MKRHVQSTPTYRRHAAPVLVLVAIALLLLCAALLGSHLAHGSSSAPVASPTVDPRLVLHAHHVPIAGTFAGSALHGSLYPGFPGANTLQIAVPEQNSATSVAAHLDLVVVMPGMRMVPATTRLQFRNGMYRGVITLPMFGTYRARLTLGPSSALRQGTARLSLPLALGN